VTHADQVPLKHGCEERLFVLEVNVDQVLVVSGRSGDAFDSRTCHTVGSELSRCRLQNPFSSRLGIPHQVSPLGSGPI
jgi:hypothetical protein